MAKLQELRKVCRRITKKMNKIGNGGDYLNIVVIKPDSFNGYKYKMYGIDYYGGLDDRIYDSLSDAERFLDGFEMALDLYAAEV